MEEEEASEECSAENETENVDLESVVVYDGFSQDSAKSTMKTWSFEDHEPYPNKDHENTSSVSFALFFSFLRVSLLRVGEVTNLCFTYETQMISYLREEVKKMQREMLELKGFVKSCVDFQKFKSASGE